MIIPLYFNYHEGGLIMSEFINNASIRQNQLKELIKQIHEGLSLKEAKKIFKEQFGEVTTEEIVQLEQSLISDGMKVEEVQRLCDVHAAVFDGSISDIHRPKEIQNQLGHPIQMFLSENKRIMELIDLEINPLLQDHSPTARLMLQIGLERLLDIDKHYSRKENLFFPVLEKKGNATIPKVMWGVDNEIRTELKDILSLFRNRNSKYEELIIRIEQLLNRVIDMVTKENNILIPMLTKEFKMYDWILIDKESDEIGYFLDTPKYDWVTQELKQVEEPKNENIDGLIQFDAGSLTQTEINAILNTVPFDMTFIDKDGNVKYFTQGKERIFARPTTILGRHVNMCHPPQSVHVVESIVNSFKNNEKDHEDFWIPLKDLFVHIRYYAVRDAFNEYLGTLEVTQNIKPIRELEGEKRLVSEREGESK